MASRDRPELRRGQPSVGGQQVRRSGKESCPDRRREAIRRSGKG